MARHNALARRRALARPGRPQRGVVLLIVISLLMLFSLVAVSFAIVAGQFKHAASASARAQLVGDPPKRDLDDVMYMLLRDTNARSSLQGHSFLKDLYDSNDGVVGQVGVTVVSKAGGQFQLMSFTPQSTFSPLSGFYNGCVLTFATGAARGYSTRVIGYDATNQQIQFETVDADGTTLPALVQGDFFLINGRAFNGTGVGFDPFAANPNIELTDPNSTAKQLSNANQAPLVYLLPHFAGYEYSTNTAVDVGGVDEPWDAPDPNNMFLGLVPPSASTSSDIMPSFHRPDLVAYWINWLRANKLSSLSVPELQLVFAFPYGLDNIPGTADEGSAPWSNVQPAVRQQLVALKRQFIFRPLSEDHPNFNGSNPNFTILGGTVANASGKLAPDANSDNIVDAWDVDNDGDGIPDSIWIDPGLPVITAPNGRQYKRLIAVLIRDMDGRMNLNTSDAIAHFSANYNNQFQDARIPAGALTNRNIPRGFGFGPADLSLQQLFGGNNSEYQNVVLGRYGSDQRPGIANQDDLLSSVKSIGTPVNYSSGPANFGSPPDMAGQGYLFVDWNGQPVFLAMGNNGETTDDPYELDPVNRHAADQPYSPAELERILRYKDSDSSNLPGRLLSLAPNTFSTAANRNRVTTLSSHIPVPNVVLPSELRTDTNFPVQANFRPATMLDMYRGKLLKANPSATPAWIDNELKKIVPFEIQHGQLFNINRWLGNGQDDNGNNVIDEYNEEVNGEKAWPSSSIPQFANNVNFSYANDLPGGANIEPRQLLARHLYCLAWLMVDNGYVMPFTTEPGLNQAQRQELTARRLAQWAINVVDFRDRDAIMTPFEYQVNPFNGWMVDGNVATDESQDNVDNDGDGKKDLTDPKEQGRRVVWGTEYPDLLLTETVAFHNRGVKDTDLDDGPGKKRVTGMKETDQDLDQFRIPQGSLFLEFYCPRNTASNNASFPMELYDANGRLDLGRLAPARKIGNANNVRHPIWRAVVTPTPVPNTGVTNPAFYSQAPYSTPFEPTQMSLAPERIVWFSPLAPTNTPEANMVFYGRSGTVNTGVNAQLQAPSTVTLAPTRYLVVGPRTVTRPGSLINGADGDPTTYDVTPESIQINTATFGLGFSGGYGAGYPVATPTAGATIQTPTGIVCAANPPANWQNQARQVGLNVSEPLPSNPNYYPEPNPTNDARKPADAYADTTQPLDPMLNACPDHPLDDNNPLLNGNFRTGTRTGHRSIFLQRLANPLLAWNPEPNDPQYGLNGSLGNYVDLTLPVNPYITVDFSDIDLTVFSGEEDTTQQVTYMMNNQPVTEDIDDQRDPNPNTAAKKFMIGGTVYTTRERGGPAANNSTNSPTNTLLWKPTTGQRPGENAFLGGLTAASTSNTTDYNFPVNLRHTLGFLNWMMCTPGGPTSVPALPAGYEGAPTFTGGVPIGAVQRFPWLVWNNRPYINPYEIMMVPCTSPARLLFEFDQYTGIVPGTPNQFNNVEDGYPFLLNFFHTSNVAQQSMHLCRVLDFIETPSPFVGTEKWYHATTFSDTSTTDAATYRPPFNSLSRFREPGRVNLNTIADYLEFKQLTDKFNNLGYQGAVEAVLGQPTQLYNNFTLSRMGYPAASYGTFPTTFSNPFRPAASADLMPNIQTMRKTKPVEATLLRPDPFLTNEPLFCLTSATTDNYMNVSRNPVFRYRGLTRLSNLVTNHSNVFAMWLTLGYFEVEPNPFGIDAGHPDGMRLGRELGVDQGTVQRHRAFYLIDRSIPVGFQPGFNHNVDRAILVRRFIE